MSRFTATNEKGERYAYGYDRPLAEYFLQKGGIELVGNLSNKPGNHSNMLQAITDEKVQIPQEHKDAIILDLPF